MPTPDVDALREKLRALGYLDAGVDRYVLAPARSDRGPWAIAWRASVRVGTLAAVLLGVPGTLALAVRLPGLFTSARDALVVGFYVSAALAGLVTASVLLVSLAAVRFFAWVPGMAQRGPLLARAAGLLVGTVALIYLTLLWQATETSTPSVGAVGAALAVAAGVSLLLGHTTAIAVLALVARDPSPLAHADRGRRGAAQWVGIGLVAFAGAVLLYSRTARPVDDVADARLVVVPTNLRLTVIAIDGFDPVFARAVAGGADDAALHRLLNAHALDVAATDDGDPVRVWTTVATGQPPARHGIDGLETRRVVGVGGRLSVGRSPLPAALATITDLMQLTRPSVTSGRDRTEYAFWEVAARAGLRTLTVNWWATWPADVRDGIILSDRALVRLQHGGDLDREIAPPDLYERLRRDWPDIERRTSELLDARWPTPASPGGAGDVDPLVREAMRLDALQIALLDRVMTPEVDLITLYLPGLDIAQHALFGEPQTLAPSLIEARRDALERAYVTLAGMVRPLFDDASRTVVVVALPGRLGTTTPGLLALDGPGISRPSSAGIRHEDIAPTVLYALGVPLSREVAGVARLDLFRPAAAGNPPVRWVESWGRRRVAAGATTAPRALDNEVRERLKSLGYVR